MSKLINDDLDSLLEDTSRSFYLTLKALPSKIRSQLGMLYLLARIADTIADSNSPDTAHMLSALEQYNQRIQGQTNELPDLSILAELQTNPAEKKLLFNVEKAVDCMGSFSKIDQKRMRECLEIIIGGQALDLRRFGQANDSTVLALQDDKELDDYAYRVAGSVGEFWTHMTLDHLFKTNSVKKAKLFETGVRFGKALQLINILRDIPEDLILGRCYIPKPILSEQGLKPDDLSDTKNMQKFRPIYDNYIDVAAAHLDAAVEYIDMLPYRQFRLRGACMLPVLIGQRTLNLLRRNNVLDGENRIKVTRTEIKQLKKKMIYSLLTKKRTRKLLEKNRDS